MQARIAMLETLEDIGETLMFVRDLASELGVVRQSYHFSPIFDEPNSVRTVIHADGFDREWLELYERCDFREHDPIPVRTMQHGDLLTWEAAIAAEPNSPEQESYFTAMREHGLEHGFGLPLYGPRGRNAYACFDFGVPLDEVDHESIILIKALAQAAHLRVCKMLDDDRETPSLSSRERQVLHWISRGKSNTDIGTILELSPETVRTYAQRIYAKLGVCDRMGATIRGLKLGLVAA